MLLIPSLKTKTKKYDLAYIPDPTDFYLPLDAYRDTMTPTVEVGQQVQKYQVIAQSQGLFASKLHAPASGTIKAICPLNGKLMIHLKNDFMNQKISPNDIDPHTIQREQFIKILLDQGIQGAGGSQFPTQLKYSISEKVIDTIIFNGVECEPYLTADYTLMYIKAAELLKTAQLIKSVMHARRIVFAIEKQNTALKNKLLENALKLGISIDVKVLPNTYPQGGELQLIKAVTKLEMKKGEIPANYGILVNNIGTLWAIHNAVYVNKPYIERVVTVSGDGCSQVGNFLIKIGTPVFHILRETNNTWNPDEHTVVLGGAMMGKAVDSPLVPIHKGSGGLLIMRRKVIHQNNCIKCGLCVDICPQKLMPLEFVRHNLAADTTALQKNNLQDCIECGACAYVCPSAIALMENIFEGKNKLSKPH